MTDEVKGLDAHIDAALAAVDAPSEPVTVEATETPAPEAPQEAAPAETTAEARARDEKGRFAAKTDPTPQTAPDATPGAAPVESTPPEANPKPVEALAWTDGHFRGWAPEKRAAFEKLPPEAQAVTMEITKDLQAEFTRKTTEFSEWKKTVEPVLSTLFKEQDLFASQGLNPIQAFQGYANIERTLTYGNYADKIGLISKICETYGIPFQAPQEADPYQAALHDQNAAVARERAKTTQLESRLNSYEQQQLSQTIQAFASATNADGTPAHPHFEAVKPAMSALLTGGKAQTLEEAYAMAVKPIEDLIAARAAEARQKVEAERNAALEKAKRAAPVKTSNAMPSGKAKASGIDAIISSALDSAGM